MMKKHIVFYALALAALCGCRNANSAEVKKALQDLSQTTENPTMALAPEESDSEAVQVGDVVEFDKTVHDFGDISVNDGPCPAPSRSRTSARSPSPSTR